MSVTIKIRRDTEARWLQYDPTPHSGELVFCTTTKRLKIGDGFTQWTLLPWLLDSEIENLRTEYGNEIDFILAVDMFKS